MQMDQKTPSYVEAFITQNVIEDEVSFLQVGQMDTYTYHSFSQQRPAPSSWNKFPNLYKFASWELNMHGDRLNWNR